MAFIDDLIRMLSGSAEGITDAAKNPSSALGMAAQPGVLSQPMAPQAAQARVMPQQRPLSPLAPQPALSQQPVMNVQADVPQEMPQQSMPPMQAAMAANPTDQRLASGMQQAPMAPQEGPGILSRMASGLDNAVGFSRPDFLGRVGNALAVAGSQDPTKALMMLQQSRAEAAKVEEARRQAMKPKIQYLGNGSVMAVEVPGQMPQFLPVEAVRKIQQEDKALDFDSAVKKAIAIAAGTDAVKAGGEARKAERESATDRVQAGLSVQQLNQIADSLEKTDTATGPILGLLPKTLRDVITPQGASLQDSAERIVQGGLRATLGGQFTQAEGDRFLARAYNPRLDEKQNADNMRTIAREIAAMQLDKKNALAYFEKNGTLEGFTPNADAAAQPQGGNAPPPSAIKTQASAAFGAYEPDKYEYGVNPSTGKFARRLKGQ